MNPIQSFYLATAELVQFLEENKESDREKRIAKIQEYLKVRDGALRELKQPLNEGEAKLVAEAIRLNEKLIRLLMLEKMDIEKDLRGVEQFRETRQKYVNPYSQYTPDGIYFDQRK